ncbi:MAG TPA: Nif3-like dinuclear metal center hexameric protein [Candidatus Coprenecus avistercoris]|uniref:GTP cyclohydrolase 1 type 2 homolog n=1 Tax=Candidatus Coprenecus avistercoris TaxID=2840730 RepID=A0A9D1E238_9BACT|nr:Nif3-like dinuclear metal center hexameric protein [Candidatus Coprenecus avistercoris]
MKASEIASVIEAAAPLRLQESWDNSGFCIGDGNSEVHGVMVGFDCTEGLIAEAVSAGADMVVTHHPLIFGGVKKISEATSLGRTIISAIRNGITVYACHTNMDKVLGGVSGTTAARIGLKDVRVLDADAEGNGLGVIGSLPEPMGAEAFLGHLKSALSLSTVRCSRPLPGLLRNVALCGGSGRSLIGAALAAGADIYVSGDISYHDFYAPDGMMIADIGHFESEAEIIGVICDILREKIPNFAVHTARSSRINPVYYF